MTRGIDHETIAPPRRPRAKISDAVAREFAALRAEGVPLREIGRRHGLDHKSVRKAIARIGRKPREDSARAGGLAKAAAVAGVSALRPARVIGPPSSARWYISNAISFVAGIQPALHESARAAAGVPGNESATKVATLCSEAVMLVNTSKILADFGIEIADQALREEALFELGRETAAARIREILESDAARSHPSAAWLLALQSDLPARNAIEMLAALPMETGTGRAA